MASTSSRTWRACDATPATARCRTSSCARSTCSVAERVLIVAVAFVLALLAPGLAAAQSPDRARIVLAPDVTPPTSTDGLQSLGTWQLRQNALRASAEVESAAGHWLPDARLGDGVAHFRLVADGKLEVGLLFRASVTDAGRVEGYNLHFRRSRVRLERLDHAGVTPLTPWESIKGIDRRDALDVYVVAIGSTLLVQLHDAESERLLDTLLADDRAFRRGRVGLRREGGRKPVGGVSTLSLSTACQGVPAPVGAPGRFVTLGEDALGRARALDPPLEPFEEVDTAARDHVVEVDTAGWLRLTCAGIDAREVSIETPLKYVDPSYRAWRETGVEETDTGFVIDRGFKDPAMVEALLEAYHERFPEQTELVEIGRSVEDRPILALAITDDVGRARSKPAILLNGAHHGNEPMSVEFVLDAIQALLENPDDPDVRTWLEDYVVWCIPVVNPDGLHAHMTRSQRVGRKNRRRHTDDDGIVADRQHGIDLNRNYPFRWGALEGRGSSPRPTHMWYRGRKAASEPETQAMMRLADSERFLASISYHTGNVIVLAPYTIEGVTSPEPNEAWAVGEFISQNMPVHPPTGRTYDLASQIYPVDGVDQDWFRHAHGTVALLVEGSNYSYIDADKRLPTVEAVRRSWQLLLERSERQVIRGRVLDAQGYPVQAEVRIAEQTLNDGEVWTSRCRDGRFARYVTKPGTWTVVARLADGTEVRREVEVPVGGNVETLLVLEGAGHERTECQNVVDWPEYNEVVLAPAFARHLVDGIEARTATRIGAALDGAAFASAASATSRAMSAAVEALEAAEAEAAASSDSDADEGCVCRVVRSPRPRRTMPWLGVMFVLGMLALRCRGRRRR